MTIEIEVPLDVSAAECTRLYQHGSYTKPDRHMHPVHKNEETVISNVETGEITANSAGVSCEGEPIHLYRHLVPEVFTISQYKVVLTDTELRQVGSKLIVQSVELPRTSPLSSGECKVGAQMILWTPPSSKCDLEKVKDLLLENTGEGQLNDRQEKVLLSISRDLPAPSACGEPTALFQTQYKNLSSHAATMDRTYCKVTWIWWNLLKLRTTSFRITLRNW